MCVRPRAGEPGRTDDEDRVVRAGPVRGPAASNERRVLSFGGVVVDEVRRTARLASVASAVLTTVRAVTRRPEPEPAGVHRPVDLLEAALTVPRQRS